MVRGGLIKQYVLVLYLCGFSSEPMSLTGLAMVASSPLVLLLVIRRVLISAALAQALGIGANRWESCCLCADLLHGLLPKVMEVTCMPSPGICELQMLKCIQI